MYHLGYSGSFSTGAPIWESHTSGRGRYRSREGLSQNELDELTSAFRSGDRGRAGHVESVDQTHWEEI